MTETVTTPTKTNKSALIRELLKDKTKSKSAIAEEVGCKVQYVFSVQNYDRVRARKLKAKRKIERQQERRNGAPKRKYTKRNSAPTTPVAAPVVKTQYIEIEVPQPHYNLTWKQRFTALFFGRV